MDKVVDQKKRDALRILVVHNSYQQRGGEDSVVDAEIRLLRSYGHEVDTYLRHNDELAGTALVSAAFQAVWSSQTMADLSALVSRFRPHVIHAHNTFPLISPSLYAAAKAQAIPVVQTLHNFRLLCPQAMFLRNGKLCESCLGKLPWRGVIHGCYRESKAQSAVLATMLTAHRLRGTYRNDVTRYVALNEFCRQKFIEGGLPPEKIGVKPNFVEAEDCPELPRKGGLFVGRLSVEKGIGVLAEAIAGLPDYSIDVIGSGPMGAALAASRNSNMLGYLPMEEILKRMQRASYLVMPSVWYENFPRTLVEAYACGLPVIASRLGAMAELIEDGKTGLLFEPGSAEDMAKKIAWAEANPLTMRDMGKQARKEYEAKYTPHMNYTQLMDIYCDAIAGQRKQTTPGTA